MSGDARSWLKRREAREGSRNEIPTLGRRREDDSHDVDDDDDDEEEDDDDDDDGGSRGDGVSKSVLLVQRLLFLVMTALSSTAPYTASRPGVWPRWAGGTLILASIQAVITRL